MATTSRLLRSPSDPSPSLDVHDAGRSSSSSGICASKTAEEVWKDITSTASDRNKVGEVSGAHSSMTLEDYLAKEGIVREDSGRIVALEHQHQHQDPHQQEQYQQQAGPEGSAMGLVLDSYHAHSRVVDGPFLGFGYAAGGSARAKRRAMQDPVDKVAQQKQRRMIKNRESAARSRERKQAYTMELEAMVAALEEEQSRLLQAQKEQRKKRLDELTNNPRPITGRRKPSLKRTLSISW